MSSLIITVISIVLVAIIAIVGVFYGGAAYQNAQAKAIANAIANQANQINNAAIQYQVNHATGFLTALSTVIGGGIYSSTAYYGSTPDAISSLLVPSYMQSLIPPDMAEWGGQQGTSHLFVSGVWEMSGSDNFGILSPPAGVSPQTSGYFMWLFANSPTTSTMIQTCKQVAIMARGTNAVPYNVNLNGNWRYVYEPAMNATLDCSWTPGGGATTIDNCLGNSNCWLRISAQVNASF